RRQTLRARLPRVDQPRSRRQGTLGGFLLPKTATDQESRPIGRTQAATKKRATALFFVAIGRCGSPKVGPALDARGPGRERGTLVDLRMRPASDAVGFDKWFLPIDTRGQPP